MTVNAHRYRITVTPIDSNGLQCEGRCGIEFEYHYPSDWMRILESTQQIQGLAGDERSALAVATELFRDLISRHRDDGQGHFAEFETHIEALLESLHASAI